MKKYRHYSDKPIKHLFALVLMVAYSLGAIEFEGIHEAFHSEEHTSMAEKNPCHRAMFHLDVEGCKHSFHLTEQKQCLLCHLAPHSDAELVLNPSIAQPDLNVDRTSPILLPLFSGVILSHRGRAPPVNC